ncbi:galactokinase [Bacillus mangrovi]|uniref:Galactokinase n=1 Tax=Metabacillus mangrovi TaxID=1491830 RepID=A0A7X2S9D3_9BACI|nr:galactokinase [Metabacillus mangrovi]MTH55600.1 galactokinase [Metabacillus mangrovi]
MYTQLINQFNEVFGPGAEARIFFAPGRVNLIGEHTDYNGGHVFPCALDVGTYCVVRERQDQTVRMYSLNFQEKGMIEFALEDLQYVKDHDWANYPKGVWKEFSDRGVKLAAGVDVLYFGNIPNGAGLSSSASIELASAVMMNELTESSFPMLDLVKMSQHAENDYIGVSCGIMDQFAIGMGRKNSAVLLDCQTLEYQYSPLELQDAVLVITNTGKRRTLADSKYNERRAECERALEQLKTKLDIQSLGDLSEEQFEEYQHVIENETDRKRARHAVMENLRTLAAVKKLQRGDIEGFGQLMNESHASLRDDYEVTGKELDALAEIAWKQPGVIGSRMTGAGFGGCTVSIVKKSAVEAFISEAGAEYERETGLTPAFYVVEVGEGAREITHTGGENK